MNCQKVKESFYQYIDGELDQELSGELEAHIEACPLCKMELEKERNWESLVKNHMVQEEAPYELKEKIVASLEKKSLFRFLPDFSWSKGLGKSLAVGTLIVIFAVSMIFNTKNTFPAFAASIDTHMEYLKGVYPLEVQSSNVKEVVAWFEGKLDCAVKRPHIKENAADLKGARICHLKDRKSAFYIFEKDGHKISAFFLNLDDADLPKVNKEDTIVNNDHVSVTVRSQSGFNSVICLHKVDKTGCILVSDMPKDKLLDLMG